MFVKQLHISYKVASGIDQKLSDPSPNNRAPRGSLQEYLLLGSPADFCFWSLFSGLSLRSIFSYFCFRSLFSNFCLGGLLVLCLGASSAASALGASSATSVSESLQQLCLSSLLGAFAFGVSSATSALGASSATSVSGVPWQLLPWGPF